MKAPKLLAVSCLLMLLDSAYADDIAPGTTMIDIFGQTAETYDYLITLDYVDGALLKPDDFFNRPSWYDHAAFVAYVLKDKATGIARRNITLLDGGEDPYFQSLRFLRYCDVGVLLLTVEQEFPQGGISADPWLTTYIFRLDTLDMIEQYSGSLWDVTSFSDREIFDTPTSMSQRYLVSCLPAERGHPFSFGLIDRKALYGPDWCGPGGTRCEVH